MRLNPFDPATRVNVLRRNHQIRSFWRHVVGAKNGTDPSKALQAIRTQGLKRARAGQIGYVQDGTSLQREFYHAMWRAAAEELGAEFTQIESAIWDVTYKGRQTRLNMHQTELDNPVTLNVAADKALCHRILARGGLPVPDHLVISLGQIREAHRFVRTHRGYFVVKPSAGTSAARGITTFVKSTNDCTRAVAIASAYNDRILIERFVPGELYRLLVLRGNVIHAIRRPGVRIRGDGNSSFEQLVGRRLSDRPEPAAGHLDRDLANDHDLRANLYAQNLDARSIPAEGREWIVKSYPSTMGRKTEDLPTFADDVTGVIGSDIKEAAVRAAALINSEFAGVELITPDTRHPLRLGDGRIIEINTTPGLGPHFDLASSSGAPNPAVLVLRSLLGVD